MILLPLLHEVYQCIHAMYENVKENISVKSYSFPLSTECPEEEAFDGRTLYERLQEQKDKKQEEWDEQHKFSEHLVSALLYSVYSRHTLL